jgi:hypothetical protein
MEPGAFWKGRVRRILYGAAIVSSLLVLSTYAGHWFVVVRSPGHQWKLSQRAMFQSEWDVAEIHLRNVIAAEPGNLGARLALADVYREISKEEPDDDAPEIAGAEDVRRTIFLDPPAAIEQLVEIANREPRNTIARLRLLETWRRIGRTEAATSIAKELVAIGSEDPRALFMVAAVELDAEHWGVAERLIRKLEPEPPKTSLAHLYLQTRWSDGTDNSDLINKTVPPVLQKFAQAETLQLEQLELAEATFLAYLVQTSIRHARQDSEFISRCNFALSIFDGLSTTTSDDVSARKRIDLGARFNQARCQPGKNCRLAATACSRGTSIWPIERSVPTRCHRFFTTRSRAPRLPLATMHEPSKFFSPVCRLTSNCLLIDVPSCSLSIGKLPSG